MSKQHLLWEYASMIDKIKFFKDHNFTFTDITFILVTLVIQWNVCWEVPYTYSQDLFKHIIIVTVFHSFIHPTICRLKKRKKNIQSFNATMCDFIGDSCSFFFSQSSLSHNVVCLSVLCCNCCCKTCSF